jgi:putative ABC transport system permease protein
MPDWAPHVRSRLASLRLSPTRENEIVDELSQHLEDRWRELTAGGASPDAATRQALADFRDGDLLARYLAPLRQARAPAVVTLGAPAMRRQPLETLRQDIKLALRMLVKDRGFAATAILTLALCIGANGALFSIVQAVLLRPLPFADSRRLVVAYDAFPGAGVERSSTSVPNYFDRLALTDVFDAQALYQWWRYRVGQGASVENVSAMNVTPSFFNVLRVSPYRGRLFTEADGTPGRNSVVLVSHAFAQKQAGGVDGIVGRHLRLDDRTYQVVGVLPESFAFLSPEVRVFVPLAFNEEERSDAQRWGSNHESIGRLAPGATIQQAQARVDALNAAALARAGSLKSVLENARYHSVIESLERDIVRDARDALQLLWASVLFVLLIAGVNITNLSLLRASGRIRDLATRHAIGATRGRIVQQLVTETTIVTLLGGAAGLGLAFWGLDALKKSGLWELPRAHEIHMDGVVVAFMLGVSVLLGVVVGAVPALQLAGLNLSSMMRNEGRSGTASRGARHARRALVVVQVALAFVLLVGAGLLLASFREVLGVDPGFRAEHVLTGRVNPLQTAYPDDAAVRSYAMRALDRVRVVPGVEAAGVSTFLPFSWNDSSNVIVPEGYVVSPGEPLVSPNRLLVSDGYLEALQVPLKSGRFFTPNDTDGAPKVVIVDELLAKKFWPNTNPIGRRVYSPNQPEDLAKPGPTVTWRQVVGVVGAVKLRGLIDGEQARTGAYYIPYAQQPERGVGFAIRTASDSATVLSSVRRALATIDPELQLFDVFLMSERVEKSLTPRKTPMMLALGFGGVALLLASLGLYGVLAYQVGQRTREIGIRMALGSDRARILRLVLREGLVLVLVGVTIGFTGVLALRGVIASQLYGVGPLDSSVLVVVTVVLAVASVLACMAPARRATQVDPVVALTQQ